MFLCKIMSVTVIVVGNGGFNISNALIKAKVFTDVQFFVCDNDAERWRRILRTVAKVSFLIKPVGKI